MATSIFLQIEEASESEEEAVSRPAQPQDTCCGLDIRPFLPWLLMGSVLLLAAATVFWHGQFLSLLLGTWTWAPLGFVAAVSIVTVLCALYCSCADPGRVKVTRGGLQNNGGDLEAGTVDLPERAAKCWQYQHPIRRYDHYCRWVNNAIGLRNHRAFIILLNCLVLLSLSHLFLDALLMGLLLRDWQQNWWKLALIFGHFCLAGVLLYFVRGICVLHSGLVATSVLSADWKNNRFHVVDRNGEVKNADETDIESGDEELYEPARNPYDKGAVENCTNFWCTSRDANQVGAF